MKKIIVLSLLISICMISYLSAQGKKQKEEKAEKFKGIIKKKPWSKSTQSYCARGSDYFVLLQNDKSEIVIQNHTRINLEIWVNEKVTIIGKRETRVIKANLNEQRPINSFEKDDGTFQCTVLDIESIE